MVIIKSLKELELMKKAGKIAANALHMGGAAIKPGISTAKINQIVHDYIVSMGAKPSFLGYGDPPFPGSICISINEEVIHGVPSSSRIISDGDIVSIDVGAYIDGFHADTAYTFACGDISQDAKKLLETTISCLYAGIEKSVVGARLGDISNAIELIATKNGYGIVKEFTGHGVGKNLHEDPQVANYGSAGRGQRLISGMTLAIEPMINLFGGDIYALDDDWTISTVDGGISAHFEHTIAVTDNGPLILTEYEGIDD